MEHRLGGHHTGSSASGLVGRDGELGAVVGCAENAAHGRLSIVVIEGEAGMGKTSLLREARVHAHRLGFVVLDGTCDELDPHRPFAAISGLVRAAPASCEPSRSTLLELMAMPPVESDPRPDRLATPAPDVVTGFASLVERAVVQQPVALIIEDLQWADLPTLRALRAVPMRMADLPIALICTRRATPEMPELTRFLADLGRADAQRVVLEPLREAEVAAITEQMLGAPPGHTLRRQLAGAGGNPLYVLELLRALDRDGVVERSAKHVDIPRQYSTPSLRLTLLRSLSHLSPATLHLLRLASILGNHFVAAELSAVAERPVVELMSQLREALASGVLYEAVGGDLAFRHELIREAIYTDLAPSIRKGLHQQAARALAGAGAALPTVTAQIALGAEHGDTATVAWMREQAEQAADASPELALEVGQRALTLASPTDPHRPALTALVVRGLLWTGQMQEARSLIERAVGDPLIEDSDRTSLRLPLVWALLGCGRAGEALDVLGPLMAARDADGETRLAAAYAHFQTGSVDRAGSLASDAVRIAEASGDRNALVGTLCLLSQIARHQGDLASALEAAGRADVVAHADRDRSTRWPLDLVRAAALMDGDRFDDASRAIFRGQQLCDERGRWRLLPDHLWMSAELRYRTGQWDDSLADIEAGLRAAEEGELSLPSEPEAYALRALIAVHRNDFRMAEAALDAGEAAEARTGPVRGTARLLVARARFDAARGARDRALRVMDTAWRARMRPLHTELGPDLISLLMESGRPAEAREALVEVEAAAIVMASPWAEAAALRCRGLVHDAGDQIVEATVRLRSVNRPLELAAACEDAGRLLAQAHRHEPVALVLLDEATAIYDHLGAERDAARVRAVLRRLGVPGRRRGSRHSRTREGGWESLTPTEDRVVELVVEGLTSPEIATRLFVSRRTVETHIAHIFAKVSVNSRAALRAASQRRAEAAPAPPTAAREVRATL